MWPKGHCAIVTLLTRTAGLNRRHKLALGHTSACNNTCSDRDCPTSLFSRVFPPAARLFNATRERRRGTSSREYPVVPQASLRCASTSSGPPRTHSSARSSSAGWLCGPTSSSLICARAPSPRVLLEISHRMHQSGRSRRRRLAEFGKQRARAPSERNKSLRQIDWEFFTLRAILADADCDISAHRRKAAFLMRYRWITCRYSTSSAHNAG